MTGSLLRMQRTHKHTQESCFYVSHANKHACQIPGCLIQNSLMHQHMKQPTNILAAQHNLKMRHAFAASMPAKT